jgi:ribonuclease BN (tRNA processing enzyme)
MRIVFLGVGDATDFECGQTSVLYEGSACLLVDCGPQIPLAVTRRLSSAEELDGIYVTHRHADHCFGLASLLLWMRQRGRRRPLTLLGEGSVVSAVQELIEHAYPGAFSAAKCFAIEALTLEPLNALTWRGLELVIAPTEHGVPNFAIRVSDGKCAVAQSGDGRSSARTRAIFNDLELLIHECAWLERASAGHSNTADLIELFASVQPRRLAVVHCATEQRSAIEARLCAALGERAYFPRPGTVLDFTERAVPQPRQSER